MTSEGKEYDVPPYVNGANSGIKGIFNFMHYNVAKGGPNEIVRRNNLKTIFNANFKVLPDAPNAGYVAEYGEPNSLMRFEKMLRFFDTNLKLKKNKTTDAWIDCLEKWESDHDWFVDEFGSKFNRKLS
jgi:hypothetical protein